MKFVNSNTLFVKCTYSYLIWYNKRSFCTEFFRLYQLTSLITILSEVELLLCGIIRVLVHSMLTNINLCKLSRQFVGCSNIASLAGIRFKTRSSISPIWSCNGEHLRDNPQWPGQQALFGMWVHSFAEVRLCPHCSPAPSYTAAAWSSAWPAPYSFGNVAASKTHWRDQLQANVCSASISATMNKLFYLRVVNPTVTACFPRSNTAVVDLFRPFHAR